LVIFGICQIDFYEKSTDRIWVIGFYQGAWVFKENLSNLETGKKIGIVSASGLSSTLTNSKTGYGIETRG
jgi:hypothetical protein